MIYQIDIVISSVIVNERYEIRTPCVALTFIGSHVSRWINYNGYSALVPFSSGFLDVFPIGKYSHIDIFTLLILLNKPLWLSVACVVDLCGQV